MALDDTDLENINRLVRDAVRSGIDAAFGARSIVELARRWQGGKLVLVPRESGQAAKEIPLETFFHKIVMVRDRLRVLEQKVNAHTGLTDEDKVEMQQYVTRCYGSLTSFNLLFRDEEDQFKSG